MELTAMEWVRNLNLDGWRMPAEFQRNLYDKSPSESLDRMQLWITSCSHKSPLCLWKYHNSRCINPGETQTTRITWTALKLFVILTVTEFSQLYPGLYTSLQIWFRILKYKSTQLSACSQSCIEFMISNLCYFQTYWSKRTMQFKKQNAFL